ncbi:MAG TPA: hypothetical protein VGR07_13480, partial [Thermoanaerobaculia bacterium]|nr:hypothetical protein [Thermoanaerobaculia bacterium]
MQSWNPHRAAPGEIDLSLSEDAVFALLYPGEVGHAGPTPIASITDLAVEWAERSPLEIADRLAAYERAAEQAGRHGRYRLFALCRALAAAAPRPEAWLDAFLARGFYGWAVPFLEQDVARRREGWERRLLSALAVDPLTEAAAALTLRLADPPPELRERALDEVARTPLLAETLAREGVPLPALRALLAVRRWQTALAAALGEWLAPPSGEVRPELVVEWTAAVLRARTAEYEETAETLGLQHGLRLVLGGEPDLALAWLETRLADPDLPVYFAA